MFNPGAEKNTLRLKMSILLVTPCHHDHEIRKREPTADGTMKMKLVATVHVHDYLTAFIHADLSVSIMR